MPALLALLTAARAAPDCAPLDDLLLALDAGEGCATVVLGALRETALDAGLESCLAEALTHRGLPVPGFVEPVVPAGPPLPEKLTRDPYGLYNAVESENFVVRWDDGITEQAAREALEGFEEGWAIEIVELGFPVPRYADTYKINVYVGDSGPNAPQLYNSPAYQSRDPEGHPMLVMQPSLFSRDGWNTAVHELNHASQDATRYSYTGAGAWYFEATASWVEVEVFPFEMDYASSIFGFAYIPHRSLDFFRLATSSSWELENYHQYGALLWPRYLTENHVDATFIRDTWVAADSRNDPMETTRELLAEQHGLDFDEVFVDFVAHNAVWDYRDRAAYLDVLAARQDDFQDQSVARRLTGPMLDWSRATTNLPERYGANYIQLANLPGADLHVQFEGDAAGDQGSEATWHLQVVIPRGNRGEVRTIEVVDGAADAWLEGLLGESDELWLAITALSEDRVPREAFGYRFFIETDAEDDEGEDEEVEFVPNQSPEPEEATGCAHAPPGAAAGLALLGLAAAARRRRSPSAPCSC